MILFILTIILHISQSTNDVYPIAIKQTLYELIYKLKDALRFLRDSFEKKSLEFKDVLKKVYMILYYNKNYLQKRNLINFFIK